MSGYLLSSGTDLTNYFEPLNLNGNINSTGSGINIVGGTGPINFSTTQPQPINIRTASTAGAIQFIANQKTLVTVGATGIIIRSPARSSIAIDLSGATCYSNFNYGYVYITPTASSTYSLTASSPRYLIVGNANNFTLSFPPTPPNGTTFHIVKTSLSNTMTLSTSDSSTFFNDVNATITSTTTPLKATYYSGRWYCCKF